MDGVDDQVTGTQLEEGLDRPHFVGAAGLGAAACTQHALEFVVSHHQQIERRYTEAAGYRADLELHGIQPGLVYPGFSQAVALRFVQAQDNDASSARRRLAQGPGGLTHADLQ